MRFFPLVGLTFYATLASGQLTELVHEDFKDNHLGWYEEADAKHSIRVKNGYYEIIAPEGGWMTYIFPFLDQSRDFSFEATFTQTEGSTDNGFGFIWGYDAATKKINNFVVSTNGYAKVYSSDESRKDAKEWKQIEGIKSLGLPNKLRVEQHKGIMKFFVNGKEEFSIPKLPWYSQAIGFVTYTNMRLLIDDFSLRSDVQINLPGDFVKGIKKINLGSGVNTHYDEVTPKISVDGKTIFFARKHAPENLGGVEDASDVWYSTTTDGIVWSKSKNMGAPVNTDKVNNIASIGQDNNSMLLAANNDFEIFERTTNGWRSAGMLGIRYENEHAYFEASLAADGKTMLFAAKNKKSLFYNEGRQEKDLFVSIKQSTGQWSEPVNLGPIINTSSNEASPFLAADGRTLYFASEGHPGYGGLDIFMSRRIGDSWTNWTKPVNLGPEINTFGFDAYYTVPASGDVAYLCTSAGGYGKSDIVQIKLPQSVKPDPVVLVLGKVLNAKTRRPVQADIIFENLITGKEAGEAISDPATGDYRIALPYGVNYGLHARAKGFLSVNENLELVDVKKYTEINKNLLLVPIEVGEAIQLNNVFFEQGRPVLKSESYPELDRLVAILRDNPTMEIELSGHTDNVGNPNSLVVLSQARVGAVKDYLVKSGIAALRITGKGYGAAKPMVKNDTEEHRRMNRRVEFKVTKK